MKNKGADQLLGYCAADLCLCFCICKKPGFLMMQLKLKLVFSVFLLKIKDFLLIIHENMTTYSLRFTGLLLMSTYN